MKLKQLIEKLNSAREKYIKKHGKEPDVWGWSFDELELVHSAKKTDFGRSAPADSSMIFKIKLP